MNKRLEKISPLSIRKKEKGNSFAIQLNKRFKKLRQKPCLCRYEGNNFKVVERNSLDKSFMCKHTYYMKLHQQFSNVVHLVLDLFNLCKEAQQVAIATAQQPKKTKKQ
jgi:hypothetical protein